MATQSVRSIFEQAIKGEGPDAVWLTVENYNAYLGYPVDRPYDGPLTEDGLILLTRDPLQAASDTLIYGCGGFVMPVDNG